jgi:hypothetical protein
MEGTRSFSSNIGAIRMMLNTTKKIHVGSVMGRLWGMRKGVK